jgi:MFS family permease
VPRPRHEPSASVTPSDGSARGLSRLPMPVPVRGAADRVASLRLASRIGRAVVIATVLTTALAYMSDDMVNVAIPSLAKDRGGTVTDVHWIVDSYYVVLVALVLVVGAIGDVVGHRRLFLTGMSLFALGAIMCAIANGIVVLIGGRGIQGAGAAMMLAAGLALVSGLIHPDRNSELSLEAVLHRLVEMAVDLTGDAMGR